MTVAKTARAKLDDPNDWTSRKFQKRVVLWGLIGSAIDDLRHLARLTEQLGNDDEASLALRNIKKARRILCDLWGLPPVPVSDDSNWKRAGNEECDGY